MSEKEKLSQVALTRLTEDEYSYIESIALQKKWTISQVLREMVRDNKQEVVATA